MIITNAVWGISGVMYVSTKLQSKLLIVDANFDRISDEDIFNAIRNHNFSAKRIGAN
jgi:formiminotetrahydrofolate cyclodeaminase